MMIWSGIKNAKLSKQCIRRRFIRFKSKIWFIIHIIFTCILLANSFLALCMLPIEFLHSCLVFVGIRTVRVSRFSCQTNAIDTQCDGSMTVCAHPQSQSESILIHGQCSFWGHNNRNIIHVSMTESNLITFQNELLNDHKMLK